MKILILFIIIISTIEIFHSNCFGQVDLKECQFQPEDRQIAEEKLKQFSIKSNESISNLIAEIGISFFVSPYLPATLENGKEETMTINLREFDCNTFVENCLALARTVKLKKTDFESFVAELEKIRYRNGIRKEYPSRLHYFSDWIQDNSQKKFVTDKPNLNGVKRYIDLWFMSRNFENYRVLKTNPDLVPQIVEQEKVLTANGFYYFPKNNPNNLIRNLKHGDIVGLTSEIEGLDVNHVGIIFEKNGEFHLLHASLSAKKVVLSEGSITDFIKPASKNSGIVIARPIF